MALVIATFIITAVFVGYHASQEHDGKIAEVDGKSVELKTLNNLEAPPTQISYNLVSQSNYL